MGLTDSIGQRRPGETDRGQCVRSLVQLLDVIANSIDIDGWLMKPWSLTLSRPSPDYALAGSTLCHSR